MDDFLNIAVFWQMKSYLSEEKSSSFTDGRNGIFFFYKINAYKLAVKNTFRYTHSFYKIVFPYKSCFIQCTRTCLLFVIQFKGIFTAQYQILI